MRASVVAASQQNAWTARASYGGPIAIAGRVVMDSDKRSKIEVLLRILLTAQTEVQMILAV